MMSDYQLLNDLSLTLVVRVLRNAFLSWVKAAHSVQ